MINIKKNRIILVVLFLTFFVMELSIWIKTDGFPGIMDQTETYLMHLPAKNFNKYGIVNLKFIDEYALGSLEKAHPYYYTHNPSFPIFVSYLLQKMGFVTIPFHTLFMVFILGFGLFYMYLAVKEYTGNEQAAISVLTFSIFCYPGVLAYGFNFHRGWGWLIIFGTLYHIKKYSSNRLKIHFLAGGFFYFLMAYYVYPQTFFLSILIISLKIFKFYKYISWKHLFTFIVLGIVPAIVIHVSFVVWAVGLNVFLEDFYLTFSKRIFGNVSIEVIHEFYVSHGLVLWRDAKPEINWDFYRNAFSMATERLGLLFGTSVIGLVAIFFILCGFKIIREKIFFTNYLTPGKQFLNTLRINDLDSRFFLSFCTTIIIFIALFPSYIHTMYVWCLMPFFIFPLSIGVGIFFSTMLSNMYFYKKIGNKLISNSFFILSVLTLTLLIKINTGHLTNDFPIQSMPGYKELQKYKGHSFATNYQSSYINYFTGEWAKIIWERVDTENVYTLVENMDYVWEKDRIYDGEKYKRPDFFFVANMFVHPSIKDPENTFNKYPLVEKGKDFWIFDLKKKNN